MTNLPPDHPQAKRLDESVSGFDRILSKFQQDAKMHSPHHWITKTIEEHPDDEPGVLAMRIYQVLRHGGWIRNNPKPWKNITPAERIDRTS